MILHMQEIRVSEYLLQKYKFMNLSKEFLPRIFNFLYEHN